VTRPDGAFDSGNYARLTQEGWIDAPAASCQKGLCRGCRVQSRLPHQFGANCGAPGNRGAHLSKKSLVKTIRRPALPSLDLLFPSSKPPQPNHQTTKSHYHIQRFSTVPNQTSSILFKMPSAVVEL
jgi:hypothetical protein